MLWDWKRLVKALRYHEAQTREDWGQLGDKWGYFDARRQFGTRCGHNDGQAQDPIPDQEDSHRRLRKQLFSADCGGQVDGRMTY